MFTMIYLTSIKVNNTLTLTNKQHITSNVIEWILEYFKFKIALNNTSIAEGKYEIVIYYICIMFLLKTTCMLNTYSFHRLWCLSQCNWKRLFSQKWCMLKQKLFTLFKHIFLYCFEEKYTLFLEVQWPKHLCFLQKSWDYMNVFDSDI